MPEYLAPGVYVEEISFRAKSIEGVSTSVAGFVGPTRYGPTEGEPELLTSFADFERIYGGIDRLVFEDPSGATEEQENYMAHAVRAFFDNGGSRLYVTRIYQPLDDQDPDSGKAVVAADSPLTVTLLARFPGRAGEMRLILTPNLTSNLLALDTEPGGIARVSSVRASDVVYVKAVLNPTSSPPAGSVSVDEGLYDVILQDDALHLDSGSISPIRLDTLDPTRHRVHLLTLSVRVRRTGQFEEEQVWNNLSPHPQNRSALLDLFTRTPASRNRYLTIPFAIESSAAVTSGAQLATDLLGSSVLDAINRNLYTDDELETFSPPANSRPRLVELERVFLFTDGSDGQLPSAETYRGREETRNSGSGAVQPATGLETFAGVEEISLVAAPGYSFNYASNPSRANQIVQSLITSTMLD